MDYFSELDRLEKERQVIRAVKINEELLEHLTSTFGWFLHYCEKNRVFPPNYEQLRQSVRRAQELMESLSTINRQVTEIKSTDKETEPHTTNIK